MKHRILALALIICMLLAGCSNDVPTSATSAPTTAAVNMRDKYAQQKEAFDKLMNGLGDTTTAATQATERPTQAPTQAATTAPTTAAQNPPSVAQMPSFDNMKALAAYLNSCLEVNELHPRFIYTGGKLDSLSLAKSLACAYIYYEHIGNEYTIDMWEYPGDKIIDAYRSGDTSRLTGDEKRVLKLAEGVASDAMKSCRNVYELEKYLIDYLADKVTYSYAGTDVPDPDNFPRHLTAVGALLDGSANCQGYTDAFYLLGTMCGFNLGRLSVMEPEGGHMLNTIELDGKWYLIDATHNDMDMKINGVEAVCKIFNCGTDLVPHFTWEDYMEYHSLQKKSDSHMFYNLPDTTWSDSSLHGDKVFSSVDKAARYIVDMWSTEGKNGFHLMVKNSVDGGNILSDAIAKQANKLGKAYSFNLMCCDNDRDTSYYVYIR